MTTGSHVTGKVQYRSVEVFAVVLRTKVPREGSMCASMCSYAVPQRIVILHFSYHNSSLA
jgi:hypothetical protein